MLGKIFLLTFPMLAGFSAVLIGGMMIAIHGLSAGNASLVALGLPLGVVCVAAIVRLNRRYQDEARAAVLANPAEILARWGAGPNERILAERGMFLGKDFLAFKAAYQTLVRARLVDDCTLELELSNIGVDSTLRRAVEVPPEALPAVRAFVARWR